MADRAGLRFGDVITEFDGKAVTSTTEVRCKAYCWGLERHRSRVSMFVVVVFFVVAKHVLMLLLLLWMLVLLAKNVRHDSRS